MYTLYYYPLNASMAPRFLLAKIGDDFDLSFDLVLVDREVRAQKSPDYLALNPSGRIPTLRDGDLVLCESPAICMYLAEKHPELSLIPMSLNPDRAVFYQWMMYLTNTLQAELMVYFYPHRYTGNTEVTPTLLEAVEQRLIDMLAVIDSQLSEHEFLAGDTLTVCDYFLFMLCVWADELKTPPLAFPHLSKHLKKMAALKEISSVCLDEKLDLSNYS